MATVATTAEKTIVEKQLPFKRPRKKSRSRTRRQNASHNAPGSTTDSRFFAAPPTRRLCDEVCNFLGLTRGQALVTRFKDGEAYVQIQENVRGADVFVMQPTCQPVDMHLMELAVDDGRVEAGFSAADHGGDSVLRICAAGSQR